MEKPTKEKPTLDKNKPSKTERQMFMYLACRDRTRHPKGKDPCKVGVTLKVVHTFDKDHPRFFEHSNFSITGIRGQHNCAGFDSEQALLVEVQPKRYSAQKYFVQLDLSKMTVDF